MQTFQLDEPTTIAQACALLDPADGQVRPVAGATNLVLMMKSRLFQPARLVSLRKLATELAFVKTDGAGGLRIGALTTLADLEDSPLAAQVAPVIVDALHRVANVRVRNVATLGGNLAGGDPHTDLPTVLVALGARIKAVSPESERWILAADFFQGYYQTALALNELITEVQVPALAPGAQAAYLKFTALSEEDWPTLGVAACCRLDGNKLRDVRLAVGAAVDRAQRLPAAEATLEDQSPTATALQAAAQAAAGAVDPVADNRGSAEYKRHLIGVYVRRAVTAAVDAAGSGSGSNAAKGGA